MTNAFLSPRRRTLFGLAAAGVLAAPFVMKRTAFAQSETPTNEAMSPAGKNNSFKIGNFKVSVISDGIRVAEKPGETFGTNQTPEAVAELLTANFLPTDKFANGFSPTVVDTGSDVVLFDTGMGEMGRQGGAGHLLEGLKAAGYAPEAVTIVVLTHMHRDHIGGLMENGAPAFPNARYVAGQTEYDFWKDEARVGTPAENGHKLVLKNVAPLAEKMVFVEDGGDVVSGISAMAAFGHSPGHMIFKVESEGKGLVLTADTANHFVLSLQKPDWEVKFDMDKAKAAASRKKVFDMVATDRLPFVGYHMPFPSVGYAERHGEGYRFVPVSYQFNI